MVEILMNMEMGEMEEMEEEMDTMVRMVAGVIETVILLKNAKVVDANILLTITVITADLIKNVYMENASVIAITMMVVIITRTNAHMIEIAAHPSNVIKELVYQKISLAYQAVEITKHVIMESVLEMDADMILIVGNMRVVSREFVFQIDLAYLLVDMIKLVIMEPVSVMDVDQTMIAANLRDAIKVTVYPLIFAYLNADTMKHASTESVNLQTH